MKPITIHASFDFGLPLNYHCEFNGEPLKVKTCRVESWKALKARFPELEDKLPISVNIYYYDDTDGSEIMIFATDEKSNMKCLELHK